MSVLNSQTETLANLPSRIGKARTPSQAVKEGFQRLVEKLTPKSGAIERCGFVENLTVLRTLSEKLAGHGGRVGILAGTVGGAYPLDQSTISINSNLFNNGKGNSIGGYKKNSNRLPKEVIETIYRNLGEVELAEVMELVEGVRDAANLVIDEFRGK